MIREAVSNRKHPSPCPQLQNRLRIWKLVNSLADLVNAITNGRFGGIPNSTDYKDDLEVDDTHWHHAGASKLTYAPSEPARFGIGCRLMHSRSVSLPHGLIRVYVSTVKLRDEEWVSGIRFVLPNGGKRELGYILSGHEIHPSLPKLSLFRYSSISASAVLVAPI